MSYKILNHLVSILRRIAGNRISIPHVMAFLRYNSLLKIFNLLHVIWEKKWGSIIAKSKPFILFLEVNNICNLCCPFCLTGKKNLSGRPKRNMTFDEMKKSIESLEKELYLIQLYNWGEPLLNRELTKFIGYAHKRKIFTMVSSNMNFIRDDIPEQIVDSGLDYFIAAIDGFSHETYSKYRRGGDFSKTITNLKRIMKLKKEKKSRTPFVEWQFVVFRHNQHEIEIARQFAKKIGIDYFHPIRGYIEDPEWLSTLDEYRSEVGAPESINNCARPWTHLNIRVDGGAAACCYEYYKKDDFGNIFSVPFENIWNNEFYRLSRQIISNVSDLGPEKTKSICYRCISKGIRPSFENKQS